MMQAIRTEHTIRRVVFSVATETVKAAIIEYCRNQAGNLDGFTAVDVEFHGADAFGTEVTFEKEIE